jgi:hypothetical protein
VSSIETTSGNGRKPRANLRPVGDGAASSARQRPKGLTIERRFTQAGTNPFDGVEWELRSA